MNTQRKQKHEYRTELSSSGSAWGFSSSGKSLCPDVPVPLLNRCTLIAVSALFIAMTVHAQSNSIVSSNVEKEAATSDQVHDAAAETAGSAVQHEQEVRMACIEGRRLICGKILDVLPEGLIVESGYTNLLREPLSRSWLIPGTAQASRPEHLLESKTPGAICVGRVLLTDIPKGKGKPARYDYVIVEAYPAGQYAYSTAPPIRRTVRRFSASLVSAVQATLEVEKKPRVQEEGPRRNAGAPEKN